MPKCTQFSVSVQEDHTSRPYSQGLDTPHSHIENNIGRPVAFSASLMASYRALTVICTHTRSRSGDRLQSMGSQKMDVICNSEIPGQTMDCRGSFPHTKDVCM